MYAHTLTQSTLFKGSLYQDFTFRFSWPGTDILISLSYRLFPSFSQDIPETTRVGWDLPHDSPAHFQPELLLQDKNWGQDAPALPVVTD